jgi:hypothetical protein
VVGTHTGWAHRDTDTRRTASLGAGRHKEVRLGATRWGAARLAAVRLGPTRLVAARPGPTRLTADHLGAAHLGAVRPRVRLGATHLAAARLVALLPAGATRGPDSGRQAHLARFVDHHSPAQSRTLRARCRPTSPAPANLGAFGDFGFVWGRKIANSVPKAQSAPNVSRHWHGMTVASVSASVPRKIVHV